MFHPSNQELVKTLQAWPRRMASTCTIEYKQAGLGGSDHTVLTLSVLTAGIMSRMLWDAHLSRMQCPQWVPQERMGRIGFEKPSHSR